MNLTNTSKKHVPTIKEWEMLKKGSYAKRSLKRDMKSNENDVFDIM